MKKLIHYLQIVLMFLLISLPIIGFMFSDAQAVKPECNYTICPCGRFMCCSEGGVTLFKNP
jgi:hypothetical protein